MHKRMLDKSQQPSDDDMIAFIGQPIAEAWTSLRQFLSEIYKISPALDSGGKKYGWNLQYRISGRPLCEMYPENGSFTVLVVLGKKELEQALAAIDLFGATIRQALLETPRFHDGCWMYMRISDPQTCLKNVSDIQQLIFIKKTPPKNKVDSDKK